MLASCVIHCHCPLVGHTRHSCVLPRCLAQIAWLPASLSLSLSPLVRWGDVCVQEQQVLSLQAAHPGVLLLVEVGYKMRMFGQDAEVAAKVMQLTELGEQAATVQDCARCAPTHAQLPAGPHAWRFSIAKAL